MRHLTAIAFAAATLLAVTGCEERDNMRELPDRAGHAYRTAGAERPMAAGALIPSANETFHSVATGDNLKTVGLKYGVSEAWLIRRNRLKTHILVADQNLIVPKQAPAAK